MDTDNGAANFGRRRGAFEAAGYQPAYIRRPKIAAPTGLNCTQITNNHCNAGSPHPAIPLFHSLVLHSLVNGTPPDRGILDKGMPIQIHSPVTTFLCQETWERWGYFGRFPTLHRSLLPTLSARASQKVSKPFHIRKPCKSHKNPPTCRPCFFQRTASRFSTWIHFFFPTSHLTTRLFDNMPTYP